MTQENDEEKLEGYDGLDYLSLFDVESRRQIKLSGVINYITTDCPCPEDVKQEHIALFGFVGGCNMAIIVKGKCAVVIFHPQTIETIKNMSSDKDRILFGFDLEERQQLHDLSLEWWPKGHLVGNEVDDSA